MAAQTSGNNRTGKTVKQFQKAVSENLYYHRGSAIHSASKQDLYVALAYTIRDHLIDRWAATTEAHYQANPKFVYYLSAEYLLGKQLEQNLLYTNLIDTARQALAEQGLTLEEFMALDAEPGLGNGGLGRLAACFIDSLATLDIPAVGYGIRYEFGIFTQKIVDGWQVEQPDKWLTYINPWEFPQPDDMVEVWFGGHTEHFTDDEDIYRVRWVPEEKVLGEPYHTLVPGYNTGTVNLLRLWHARATNEFDFKLFDTGDYARAVAQKVASENITKVLYPNDHTPQGRELRLKQQYFFVSCSLRDIIRRFFIRNTDWDAFPDKVAIQLNDTHPVIAIPELMRILVDEYQLAWDRAWHITQNSFAYTCHTLLPEALEKWPVDLLAAQLPRHLEIIFEINFRFLNEVRAQFPGDEERVIRMSIIQEGDKRMIRMANLASVGCFAINGVAELHSKLLQERTLLDFAQMWPQKFQNKTNGVTPRRFIKIANPRLAQLITANIGPGWLTELEQLAQLEQYVDDPAFQGQWQAIKRANKAELAALIKGSPGLEVDPDSIFDVMVKRLHEYKRQLLKVLHIITLYNRLKDNPKMEFVPRTFIFGAKAAPGYVMAKLIIKLINNVAAVVNADPLIAGRLKVVFLENFNVSLAQKIYPAADISQQISLAGKEASGTGNMKFALNGAITTGTLDGANIEIRERVGVENFFLFGLTTEEVFRVKENFYNPQEYYQSNPELKRALDAIATGHFSRGDTKLFAPIIELLLYRDDYLLLVDYASYIEVQEQAAQVYRDTAAWTRMSILNTARSGFFSSDRSICQYCADIWHVSPLKVGLK
jgi:starch phosphorylase